MNSSRQKDDRMDVASVYKAVSYLWFNGRKKEENFHGKAQF